MPKRDPVGAGGSGSGRSRRRWILRLAPAGLLLLLPLVVEAGLRLAGAGRPTSFLFRAGDYWLPNEKFAQQFFSPPATSRPVYFRVPVQKRPETVRIVVLGESAAMGTPDPAFSFSRILEVMLEQRVPGKRFEPVNAAMRGIDSHVVRRIAEDCAPLQPDLFIIYMGNNEVIGLHGPEPECSRVSQWLPLIRTGQFIKSTRIWQALRRNGKKPRETQDIEFFRKQRLQPDDWRREAVRRNFAANLEDICHMAAKRGIPVVLSTVPVNVKDFPPLASLGDESSAEEQFRLAQKFLAAGDTNQARQYFERSLDWDALQFRADTKLNERIRDMAAKFSKDRVRLVDAVETFREADDGIPGAKLFRDHVHPTFEGDYLLARTLLPAVEAAVKGSTESRPTSDIPSRDDCTKLLAYTEWHDAQIQLAMADLTSRPPYHDQLNYRQRQAGAEKAARERVARLSRPEIEAALQTSLAAMQRRPDDWMLHHNCAQLFRALGQPPAAIEHFEFITKMFPRAATFRMLLGQSLASAGRFDAAIYEFEAATKLDPDDERARDGLAQLRKYARK